MNNSRNFTNDISNKSSFISLKTEINKKIKETLFDDNSLFLSTSFNYFCNNYKSIELVKEGISITNLLDNKLSLNEEESNKNSNSINNNPIMIANGQNANLGGSSESKKKVNESEEEKSSSLGSNLSKITKIEENKQKYNIKLLNYSEVLDLLNINNNEISINTNNEENKEELKMKINNLKGIIKDNENIEVKNNYLRKMVVLKLFKALNFALKNFNLEKNEIKQICLYIEIQGRIIDGAMTNKYKEFIENIMKKISYEIKKDT